MERLLSGPAVTAVAQANMVVRMVEERMMVGIGDLVYRAVVLSRFFVISVGWCLMSL